MIFIFKCFILKRFKRADEVKVAWAKNLRSVTSSLESLHRWNGSPSKIETDKEEKKEKCVPHWPALGPDPPHKDHMKRAEVVCSDGKYQKPTKLTPSKLTILMMGSRLIKKIIFLCWRVCVCHCYILSGYPY